MDVFDNMDVISSGLAEGIIYRHSLHKKRRECLLIIVHGYLLPFLSNKGFYLKIVKEKGNFSIVYLRRY